MKMILRSCFIVSFFILATFDLAATTYYVASGGADTNSGLSLAQAFLTLQKAADVVAPGDVVIVQPGEYTGFYLETSGTAAMPILFTAADGVVINEDNATTPDGINLEGASYVIIDNFEVTKATRAGIRIVLANNCIVRNSYCHGNGRWGIFTGFTDDLLLENNECSDSGIEHGIYVSNSSDRSVIRNNLVHHNNASGIQINADVSEGGDGISTDAQIYNNVIWENGVAGGAALNLDGAQNPLIYNNLIYENHATGIALFDGDAAGPSSGAQIYHNTIIQAADGRWCILAVGGSSGAQILNNILINQHSFRGALNIDAASLPGLNSNHNLMTPKITLNDGASITTLAAWQGMGQDVNSLAAPSLADIFVNPTGSDYHLTATSPAINLGVNDLGILTDLDGVSRSATGPVDAGAYAFNTSLPVHLVSFEGFVDERSNLIKWDVALAYDFSHFELERSSDAINYKTITKLFGLNQAEAESYNYRDIKFPSGTNYYRLKMVDIDGQFVFSPVISLTNHPGSALIYPNPFQQVIYSNAVDCHDFRLTRLDGQLIKSGRMCTSADLSALPIGIYLYQTINGTQLSTIRLVKGR